MINRLSALPGIARSTARAIARHRRGALWSLLALVTLLIVHRVMDTAYVELHMVTGENSKLVVYWADTHENFSERRQASMSTFSHRRHYALLLDDIESIDRLRIDPANRRTTVKIREVSIYQFGADPIRLVNPSALTRLQPRKDVEAYRLTNEGLEVTANGPDLQLELKIDAPEVSLSAFALLWRTAAILVLVGLAIRCLGPMSRDYRFVPYLMLLAFSVVFMMAESSRINAHPDEYMHVLGARYFTDHHAPPAACQEGTLHAYSPYGVSRMNSTEIAYFATGKFAAALAFLPVSESFRLRYFNVTLFGLLLLLSIVRVRFRIMCLPLLLSPQVWYLFSYVNSEGLAIFATMIAAHQAMDEDSALRRLITARRLPHRALHVLALGVLLGVLLLVKKNFYVFLLFAGLWLGAWFLIHRPGSVSTYLRRILPVIAIGLAVYGTWIYQHEAVNDFDRDAAIDACRDRLAYDQYSESTPLEKTLDSLYLREKGYPFSVLFDRSWGTKVFHSAVGDFGYLELHSGDDYYHLVAAVLLALFAYVAVRVIRYGNRLDKITLALAAAMFAFILAATMWKSWTRDFQPQGRYFFPMLPIVAVLFANVSRVLNRRVVAGFVIVLAAFALYFFVYIGLAGIRKY